MDFLDAFIKGLLHTDDVRCNKLLNIGDTPSVRPLDVAFDAVSGKKSDRTPRVKTKPNMTIRLFAPNGEDSKTMLRVIRARRGKPSNKTVLRDSATVKITADNPLAEKWDWASLGKDGSEKNPVALDAYIAAVYNALDLKGNNPLFLGVGNLGWQVAAGDKLVAINSPVLVFPIRFVRGTGSSPVEIEFVDDDAYFNPCLINRLRDEFDESIAANFPHPNGIGADFDEAIDLDKLGDGEEYMSTLAAYITALRPENGEATISFDKNVLAVSEYNHEDICMYYDVKRNRQKIYDSQLVRRIFCGSGSLPEPTCAAQIRPVLPVDSVQDGIISEIVAGKSMIIKGPPGTGKTLTIVNILSTLLACGKSVLISSQKLAALGEVYAKLPEKLRPFVMLLDYETEQAAAAVNPSNIRAELKKLVNSRREYVYDGATDIEYQRADRARSDAMLAAYEYCADMFGEDVAWGSYYDAVNLYFQNADLPEIPFCNGVEIASVSREGYNRSVLAVKDAAAHYSRMSSSTGRIADCPWLGVHAGCDIERALADMGETAALMTELDGALGSVRAACKSLHWDSITYGDIFDASRKSTFSVENMRRVLSKLDANDVRTLELAMDNFEKAGMASFDKKIVERGENGCEVLPAVDGLLPLGKLKFGVVKSIADGKNLLMRDGVPLGEKTADGFIKTADKIGELAVERDGLEAEVMFILDKAKFNAPEIVRACMALKTYSVDGKRKPDIFDFKAKSAVKRLRALCSRGDIQFVELAKTAAAYARIAECDRDISALGAVLANVIGKDKLTAFEYDSILATAKYSRLFGADMHTLVRECAGALDIIDKLGKYFILPDDYVISELVNAVALAVARGRLELAVIALCNRAALVPPVLDDVVDCAYALAAVLRIGRAPYFNGDADAVASFVIGVQALGDDVVRRLCAVTDRLAAFGDAHFANDCSRSPWHMTRQKQNTYVLQSRDRSIINAALGYNGIVHGDNALPLDTFFAPMERGEISVEANRIVDLFTHSCVALAIKHKQTTLGPRRSGLAKNVELALESFGDAEKKMFDCNVLKIEKLCMARIDANDDDFEFLNADRGISMSLRVLFRTYAAAIRKLKRCFITSPSTASVLFGSEAFEGFDVVIADEASQLEPVEMLPVLFRSKQCVLVGDEFQMPPLTHFKAKNNKRISDPDSELTLDNDISALSLALGNLAFDVRELVCHYRSKTETLIDFSQREFYPYMRTFPSVEPATADLGFDDIYTKDGCCEDGVNAVEAERVVGELKAHFDRYRDAKTGALSMSVGVVTFGEAQLSYVERLVAADGVLSDRITEALRAAGDVPDKTVFFRTIETVQGQETDHLILSLTYGRDRTGKLKLAFGELNRDATGKNIFNVAVTRARCRITVIHSVTANELVGNPRITFIQKYLAAVERYCVDGRARFESRSPEKGEAFVGAVRDCIESFGVAEDRIVVGYGVTDGSVRIPIAILSKDMKRVELGVWCERPVLKKYDYFDYNVRYVSSLESRGWALHKVYAHDFIDNSAAEKAALGAAIKKYVAM